MNVETMDLKRLKTFSLVSDLLVVTGVPKESSKQKKLTLIPLFSPKDFVKANKNIKVERYELGQEDLMRYGKQVTMLRAAYLN